MNNDAKYIIRYLVYTFLVCIFVIIGAFYYKKSIGKTVVTSVNYSESSDIDYKVFLKKNNFFEEKFLEKKDLEDENKTLITQLIDYIKINYIYSIEYDKPISGKYSYYLKAKIEANKANAESGNYWSKEYILTDKKTIDFNNSYNYSIVESIDIDYDKYNDLLNEFKKSFNLSIDGALKIVLVIENEGKSSEFTKPFTINANPELNIPLTKAAMEIKIDTNDTNKTNNIVEKFVSDDKIFVKYQIGMIVSLILAIIFIILMILSIKAQRNANRYYVKLKKILSTYDSIIVNVSSLPDMDKFNVINVRTFEELLDAHSEVRMPINYYKSKNKATFILVNDTILWIYILRNDKA